MRFISIILLTALVFSFSAFRLVYQFIIKSAKDEATFTMKTCQSGIQELRMTHQEYSALSWRENGKEFASNGQLYDVMAIHRSGNQYLIMVYADKNETRWVNALNRYLKDIFSMNRNNNSDRTEGFFYSLQKEYPPLSSFIFNCCIESKTLYFANFKVFVPSPAVMPVWHPPVSC